MVRLDPRSEDTAVLFPELAEQVVSAEQEKDASVLALSTLHFHTDRSDPKPILSMSWKPAEGKERCKHARPGVIVLGEGRNTFLQVCIAKKACEKHWPRPSAKAPVQTEADIKSNEKRQQQEAEWQRRQADAERWRKELRPRAMRLVAECTVNLQWSRMLMRLVLEELQIDDTFVTIVGKPDALPVRRYPQAIAVALARKHSWQRDTFLTFTKRLGVQVTAKALADLAEAPATNTERAEAPSQRPQRKPKRA